MRTLIAANGRAVLHLTSVGTDRFDRLGFGRVDHGVLHKEMSEQLYPPIRSIGGVDDADEREGESAKTC